MKHRILVVDGDLLSREILRTWLESEGHETILAETLEEGFVKIANPPLPSVVLLDIQLGNHSGLTLVHWVRRQHHLANVPFAAMATIASFKDFKRVEEAGCDTCFTKPIDFRSLRTYLFSLQVYSDSKVST
ncbi:MAG TPA: response regulator [Candidatus Saccharimonadales bacterium]|nr:response regulator [Candidatus Saccharimonadales bacterium]